MENMIKRIQGLVSPYLKIVFHRISKGYVFVFSFPSTELGARKKGLCTHTILTEIHIVRWKTHENGKFLLIIPIHRWEGWQTTYTHLDCWSQWIQFKFFPTCFHSLNEKWPKISKTKGSNHSPLFDKFPPTGCVTENLLFCYYVQHFYSSNYIWYE